MKKVLKWPLEKYLGGITIEMPRKAIILSIQLQNNQPVVWAECDENEDQLELRCIAIFGTDHEIPPNHTYITTVQDGPFAWHFYEQKIS
jgi:hypothetical protein